MSSWPRIWRSVAVATGVLLLSGSILLVWLSTRGQRPVRQTLPIVPTSSDFHPGVVGRDRPFALNLWSLNVLGGNHTAPGGDAYGRYAPGPLRAARESALFRSQHADIVGTQETTPAQLRKLAVAGWHAYPDARSWFTHNAVLWNSSRFALIRARVLVVPFMEWTQPQTVVLLRERTTGRLLWVVNVHLTPRRKQDSFRDERIAADKEVLRTLRALRSERVRLHESTGASSRTVESTIPVVLTGDFNQQLFPACEISASGMLPASGSRVAAQECRGPILIHRHSTTDHIDWIFASPGLRLTDYRQLRTPETARLTDHAILSVRVHIPAVGPTSR